MKETLHFTRRLAAACLAVMLFACTLDMPEGVIPAKRKTEVDQARSFFEEQILTRLPKSSQAKDVFLYPGTFTPKWNTARVTCSEDKVCVETEFYASQRFLVDRSTVIDSDTVDFRVVTWQKIAVIKDRSSGEYKAYFLTLIPRYDYYLRHRNLNVNNYSVFGSNGGFCGKAAYTDMISGRVCRAEVYLDGKLKASASIDECDSGQMSENLRKIGLFFRGMTFLRQISVATRGGEGSIWIDPVVCVGSGSGNSNGSGNTGSGSGSGWTDWGGNDNGDDSGNNSGDFGDNGYGPGGGSGSGIGTGGDNSGGVAPPSSEPEPLDTATRNMINMLHAKVRLDLKIFTRTTVSVFYGTLPQNKKAYGEYSRTQNKVNIIISKGYNEDQLALIMFHEFYHIHCFEEYPDLDDEPDTDAAHHEWMSNHLDEYERQLREIYPGQPEDFYIYGKWGGLLNTETFKNLSWEYKDYIYKYLNKVNLN